MHLNPLRTRVRAHVLLAALLALLTTGALPAQERLPQGLAGDWRGEFALAQETLPFNFQIRGDTLDDARLVLLNKPRVEAFRIESRGNGEYVVPFRNHDTELQLALQADGSVVGRYHHLVASRQSGNLAFVAHKGLQWRFVPDADGSGGANVAGKWRFTTVAANGSTRERVAVFEQHGNRVTGVLLSPTGDSRALQGNVVDGELRLSGFTGPAPSLYLGRVGDDGVLAGKVSTARGDQAFTAVRDATTTLPDPFALTRATSEGPVQFAFPDSAGRTVSLDDPRYRGKVVAVQILGTWCPNCVDETRFLAPWHRDNHARGVEVIGIAFEQEDDATLAAKTLPRYREFYEADYELLFGGGLDKAEAGERLPWLSEVIAYPTLVLLDRRGRVREIYTGFSSPETGEPYLQFVQRFNATVDALLAEPVPEG